MITTTVSGCLTHGSDDRFRIALSDDVSGQRIIEISMDAQQFADFVTTHYTTAITAEVYAEGAGMWGRFVRENRTIEYPFTFDTFEADYLAARASAPEGWIVEELPLDRAGHPSWNHHMIKTVKGRRTYSLRITRMVPVGEDVTA